MFRSNQINPDNLRIRLAHALGYADYPTNLVAEPYLRYLSNRHLRRGTRDQCIKLFIRVVEYFHTNSLSEPIPLSIRSLLDTIEARNSEELYTETRNGDMERKEYVEDAVMYIMGAWSMMLSSFVQLPTRARKVVTLYNVREGEGCTSAYDENFSSLVTKAGLLPSRDQIMDTDEVEVEDEVVQTAMKLVSLLSRSTDPRGDSLKKVKSSSDLSLITHHDSKASRSHAPYHPLEDFDSLEALSIKATRLNAYTLNLLGAVEIAFTRNISRHMILSRHRNRCLLEIFALPCAFQAASVSSGVVGITSELIQEIEESYCILFNAWSSQPLHAKVGKYFGIRRLCWCWSCAAYRYRKDVIAKYRQILDEDTRHRQRKDQLELEDEFDPQIVKLMEQRSSDWSHELFPSLWPRIMLLEEHLQAAKPWSIWILFRDRRDTLQFWTFFFATVVVLLTFLQVILGLAQVVGSFE